MISRRKKGSHRRRKTAKSTAQTHLKIARQRRGFHSKMAKQYTERYQLIASEKLSILNMVQNHSLAKSIMDASWGAFLAILSEKAERAVHTVVREPTLHLAEVSPVWGDCAGTAFCADPYLPFLWVFR
jgi:putative transposase